METFLRASNTLIFPFHISSFGFGYSFLRFVLPRSNFRSCLLTLFSQGSVTRWFIVPQWLYREDLRRFIGYVCESKSVSSSVYRGFALFLLSFLSSLHSLFSLLFREELVLNSVSSPSRLHCFHSLLFFGLVCFFVSVYAFFSFFNSVGLFSFNYIPVCVLFPIL